MKYIRWVLTLMMLYGIYTETGPWTTLAFFLIFVAIEIQSALFDKLLK